MTGKRILFLTFLLVGTAVRAEEEFTLEDLNFGGENYKQYVPETRDLVWHGDELIRLDDKECFTVGTATGKERLLFTLEELSAALEADANAPKPASLHGLTFPYADEPLCYISDGTAQALYDYKAKAAVWSVKIDGASAVDWQKDSRRTAFVRDYQMCVADAEGNIAQLTTDGDERNIIYGQAVHREEFGITKGTFWSPKGNRVAFYRMDQTDVNDYPQVIIPPAEDGSPAVYAPDKYPMTGGVSHTVRVGVYDFTTGKTVCLDTGDPGNRYFTNIAWSPDERVLYMFELNREQNDCRLTAYDSATGERLGEIYRETDDKYVEPRNPILFLPWDGNKFILQSRKDGFNHLYLFDERGNFLAQLTKGNYEVMDIAGFDVKNKAVIYMSNEVSNMQRNTYKLNISTGKRTLADSGGGWHNALVSGSGAFIADVYSEPDTPRKIDIINTRSGKTINYLTAADPWAGHKQPSFRAGTILAADDSTLLNYRLVLPPDFEEAKRYPAIVYVYGGPHAHCVDSAWHYSSRSWETYMAQKGFIVFVLDNRGSENRGKAFEQVTFHRLGEEEMKDQMRGVAFLKSLPYVDGERLGVHGWSFGGFMTISLMTHYPDVFKVGVAGGPVVDWRWYEVMYGERYMGTPQSNPEGYARTSLLPRAKDLKGRLQIIIGGNDDTVVPQHSLAFINECIRYGVQPDFFVYPGEPHNMRGHASVHLHERITDYFVEHL
ncbi:MAG: S9 family peptidase [Prevotella sp.]|nr:S9 family peptidase [Prevotella sp.]